MLCLLVRLRRSGWSFQEEEEEVGEEGGDESEDLARFLLRRLRFL